MAAMEALEIGTAMERSHGVSRFVPGGLSVFGGVVTHPPILDECDQVVINLLQNTG
jgi:hypothetical protein